jgi:hypothetical protein
MHISGQTRDKVSGAATTDVSPITGRLNRRVGHRVHVPAGGVWVNVRPTRDTGIGRDGHDGCACGGQVPVVMWLGGDRRAAADQEHGETNGDVLFESHRREYRTWTGCRDR